MKIRAMVVDDSRVMRKLVMHALNRIHGYHFEFVQASNGRAARELFELSPIDMVLVDRNMPQMTGIDLIRHIRQTKHLKQMAVVMVSCESTLEWIEEALLEGADAYVCKPFSDADIDRKVSPLVKAIAERPKRSSLLFRLFG